MDTPTLQATPLESEYEESTQESANTSVRVGFIERTRERITDYVTYKNLKVREYFGKLNEDQLDALLNFEFVEELKDNPPLENNFDPELELNRIRKLSKDQKRIALDEFKINHASQKEAWAKCYSFIRRKIHMNADVEFNDLSNWVSKFSKEYKFSDQQTLKSMEILNLYYSNQHKMKDFRAQYPNDMAMLEALTGAKYKPDTKFEINVGAFGIEVYTDTFTVRRIQEHIIRIPYSGKPFSSRGFSYSWSEIPFTVSIDLPVNILYLISNLWMGSHRDHEDQHIVNHYLMEPVLDTIYRVLGRRKELEVETDIEIKKLRIQDIAYEEVSLALRFAKNEIIAIKKDSGGSMDGYLTITRGNNSYDYLNTIKEVLKSQNLYSPEMKRTLVDDYNRSIKNALVAFNNLRKQNGLTVDETIALLIDQTLTTGQRLLKE